MAVSRARSPAGSAGRGESGIDAPRRIHEPRLEPVHHGLDARERNPLGQPLHVPAQDRSDGKTGAGQVFGANERRQHITIRHVLGARSRDELGQGGGVRTEAHRRPRTLGQLAGERRKRIGGQGLG